MIRIVGDVCFSDRYFDIGFGIGSKLKQQYNPFEKLNLSSNSSEIWFGNLECVISDISNKTGYRKEYFRVPFNNVSSLHHLDYYSVANNHIMEHGSEAFQEMLANLNKLGRKYAGNLSNKTIIIEHKEHKFGFAVFSQRGEEFSEMPLYWQRPEYKEIELEFEKMNHCEFRIAYMHWGNEFINYPNGEQKKFAHWLIDIGFDLVVGTHPHVLQGYEVYNRKHIFYSLGNFLFNMPTEETRYSGIVNLDVVEGKLAVSYNYVLIDKENRPNIIAEENVPDKYLFETLNKKISFEIDNENYYKDMFKELSIYRHKNYRWVLLTLHKHNIKEIVLLFYDFISRRLTR